MKKRILLVIDNMKIGGIQKNMLNLVTELCDKYDLTLCIFYPVGAFLNDIPQKVKIITPNSPFKYLGMSNKEASKHLLDFLGRSFFYGIMRLFGNKTMYKCMLLLQKNLGEYDYAISGMQSAVAGVFFSGCNELILERVKAQEKIAYIHCDYILSGIDNPYNRTVYRSLDKVIVPNLSNMMQLVSVMPDIKEKVHIVNNFCNYSEVLKKSTINPVEYEEGKTVIITVARISQEKGIDRAIAAIELLKNDGYNFAYHVVGDGEQYEKIKTQVEKLGLTQYVILHGFHDNPYRFIKNADLFLLPSRNEAAGLVIDESRALGVPVLSTKTVAAEETISLHDCGWVCDNSEKGIYEGLKELLDQPLIIKKKSAELKEKKADNAIPIAQFERMLG